MIELIPHDMANGGEAVARRDGKTWFVAGAMPGERILGEILVDKGSWGRVALTSIAEASVHRVTPPCAHFGSCGGCHWQFAEHGTQLDWKRSILAGQLTHLGRLRDPEVRPTVAPSAGYGYRNRMDFSVTGGQQALFRKGSRTLVPIDTCWLLEPALSDLVDRLGPLHGVERLTVRVATGSGDAMVVVTGEVPDQADTWEASVVRRHPDGYEAVTGDPWITEVVDGRSYRITADAFFQTSTVGAETLVSLVREAAELHDGDIVLDGYAGGGLFTVAMAGSVAKVIAVESHPVAVDDLRFNTAGLERVEVVHGKVERHDAADPWKVAVVDPPRTGLGVAGVGAVTAPFPRTVVYVSCDPASLARDARLLADAGYELAWAVPVDLFPQTFHIETVARFCVADVAGLDGTDGPRLPHR
ncbi:23S rRNA (uracil(1939)-C(5))-methyltransferase RlmD [soil metagenome]